MLRLLTAELLYNVSKVKDGNDHSWTWYYCVGVNNTERTSWVNSHLKYFPSIDRQLRTCNCSTVSLWAFSILFIFVLKLDSWYWKSAFNSVNCKTQILSRFLELQQDTSSRQYVKYLGKPQESQETLFIYYCCTDSSALEKQFEQSVYLFYMQKATVVI